VEAPALVARGARGPNGALLAPFNWRWPMCQRYANNFRPILCQQYIPPGPIEPLAYYAACRYEASGAMLCNPILHLANATAGDKIYHVPGGRLYDKVRWLLGL
jgi:hypothetical protein